MTERTTTFSSQIGGQRFEIASISYGPTRISRPQYKVDGKVVSRAVFFTMKNAAKATV